MAVAFNRAARVRFVLPEDEALPADQQTVWILRPLTVFETMELESEYGTSVEGTKAARYAVDMLRRALVGWENLKLEDGTQAPFVAVNGVATDATIEFAQPYLLPLFVRARQMNSVTQGEAGKS